MRVAFIFLAAHEAQQDQNDAQQRALPPKKMSALGGA
jgi:hypothetical protein